uniref:Uncharacterized protein n=1 Tax=Oryzias melastigma TaxID=30732 RepID=A0A3B3DDN8_ORYME
MFTCRAAWQRSGSAAFSLPVVPRRSMSSVPGGSGENIVYSVLCGGAYSTVNSDHNRFNSRLEDIRSRPKAEWVAKPWPPKSKCFFF